MTVIAYRDGVIAADSLAGVGGAKTGLVIKIARNKNGDLAGAAGSAGYCYSFREWFEGRSKKQPKAESDDGDTDRGLIVRRNGQIEIYESGGMFMIEAPYYALGSGSSEARGAMFAGADAVTAVLAGIEHDEACGGPIHALSHDGKIKVGVTPMPLTKKGTKIKRAMAKQYGAKKGEQVFYASKNAKKIKGVEKRGRKR